MFIIVNSIYSFPAVITDIDPLFCPPCHFFILSVNIFLRQFTEGIQFAKDGPSVQSNCEIGGSGEKSEGPKGGEGERADEKQKNEHEDHG